MRVSVKLTPLLVNYSISFVSMSFGVVPLIMGNSALPLGYGGNGHADGVCEGLLRNVVQSAEFADGFANVVCHRKSPFERVHKSLFSFDVHLDSSIVHLRQKCKKRRGNRILPPVYFLYLMQKISGSFRKNFPRRLIWKYLSAIMVVICLM